MFKTLISSTLVAILICLILITYQSLWGGSYALVYRYDSGDIVLQKDLSYWDCIARTTSEKSICRNH